MKEQGFFFNYFPHVYICDLFMYMSEYKCMKKAEK